jgi:penicillin amidase
MAVSGTWTAHGAALVANDMHLDLRLPNIWFRASLVYPGPDGAPRRVTGVTLPGAPAVVVGSNGHVAWGFTNSYGDFVDLVRLVEDGGGRATCGRPMGACRSTPSST